LSGVSNRSGTDQLGTPDSPPARVDPRRPSVQVVKRSAHDRGAAVGGQPDGDTLGGVANRAGADQLFAQLGPDIAAARVDPRRPSVQVVKSPPTMAVLPSSDSATEMPWAAFPTAPVPASLLRCWVQTPLLRVKTHAAPLSTLSADPPTMAVLPSAESATETPCLAFPTAPLPTSFLPCWVQTPLLRV